MIDIKQLSQQSNNISYTNDESILAVTAIIALAEQQERTANVLEFILGELQNENSALLYTLRNANG